MVKEINIYGKYGKGKVCLVDDEDFDNLNKYRWYLRKNGRVARLENFHKKAIYIHREILNFNEIGKVVDHKNGNPLDNRKENLRIATPQENARNQRKRAKITTSKYKGVSWHKASNSYRAFIAINQKYIHIGHFASEIEAAEHYDYWAIQYFKEFACLNFPEKNYSNFIPKQLKAKTSIYKNVSWYKNYSKWLSFITYNKKVINLGYFLDEKDAAHHSDYLNWFLFKNKSKLNFPEVDYDKYIPTKLNSNTLKLINYGKI